MLDQPEEALLFYQRIIDRGIDSLAYDKCGEGRARARGFYADSLYRMSYCHLALGDKEKASEMMELHLRQRGPGWKSIYPIANVREEARELTVEYG